MNYYEHYMGDYAKKTATLKLVDHGAYRVLLDEYYANERPLPQPYPDLYHICRAITKAEQDAVRKVAELFFPVAPDGLRHNERADRELERAIPRIEASRVNGKKGGRKPRGTPPNGNPPGNPTDIPSGNPPASQQDTHRPTRQGAQPGDPHAPYPIPNGRGTGDVTVPAPLPGNLSPATWRSWKAHLANCGKGMTPQQEALQLHRLGRHPEPERVVLECIERGHKNLPPEGGWPKGKDERRAATSAGIWGDADEHNEPTEHDITGEARRVG